MSRLISAGCLSLGLMLGGCFIPTGDGCPWGGCRDDGSRVPHLEPTLAPSFDPFVQGSHYRAGPYNAYLSGAQLLYRDQVCEYEAVAASDATSASLGGWQGPPASLQRVYRVERVESGCSNLSVGDLLRVAAVGQSRVRMSDPGEQLWLGPVTADRPARILSRS